MIVSSTMLHPIAMSWSVLSSTKQSCGSLLVPRSWVVYLSILDHLTLRVWPVGAGLVQFFPFAFSWPLLCTVYVF
jgi:hypothetical protein